MAVSSPDITDLLNIRELDFVCKEEPHARFRRHLAISDHTNPSACIKILCVWDTHIQDKAHIPFTATKIMTYASHKLVQPGLRMLILFERIVACVVVYTGTEKGVRSRYCFPLSLIVFFHASLDP